MKTYKARIAAVILVVVGFTGAHVRNDWIGNLTVVGMLIGSWVAMNLIIDNIKDEKSS